MAVPDLNDFKFWIPTAISIVAVALFYVDMRIRLGQEKEATKSMLELVGTMREELDLFRQQSEKGALTSQEIERQKLLQRQREQQWRETRDLFKGLKWLAERENDEDE